MKQTLPLLTALLLLLGTPSLHAQKGLEVNKLFEGHLFDKARCVETHVQGRRLAPYRLDLFRSLRLTPTAHELSAIEAYIRKDAALAEEKETELRHGRMVYALLQLPHSLVGHRRYVGFLKAGSQPDAPITIVYMEGRADMNELKKLFSH